MTDDNREPVTPEWLRQISLETLHDEDPRGGPICNEGCPACALNKAAEALRTATQRADFAEESLRRETVWRSQDKDRIDRLCKRAEKAEFERDQLDSFNPERSMLQAVQKSLHEKDALLKVAEEKAGLLSEECGVWRRVAERCEREKQETEVERNRLEAESENAKAYARASSTVLERNRAERDRLAEKAKAFENLKQILKDLHAKYETSLKYQAPDNYERGMHAAEQQICERLAQILDGQ